MSCSVQEDFCVQGGATWHPIVRWGQGVMTTKAITGITHAAPPAVTATAHGLPNGWPAAVVGVEGMVQINASHFPPRAGDWHDTAVVDVNTVQLLDVDASNFTAYLQNGYLVYDTPQPLTGKTFALSIYANPDHSDAVPLATLTSTGGQITVDTLLMTITPLLQTAGLAWTTGYYKLTATDGAGVITELLRGTLTIEQ